MTNATKTKHEDKIDRLLEAMAKPSALKEVMGVRLQSIDELRRRYAHDEEFRFEIDGAARMNAQTSNSSH